MILRLEPLMRPLLLLAASSALLAPTGAQSLQVYGTSGYLSEYELSASVSEQVADGKKEFSGPLIVKHVGLCTHNGPNETAGRITLRMVGSSSRVQATLAFGGNECTYRGLLSQSYHGVMSCAGKAGIPVRLWTK
jgi:hypothetical protein